jgi:hypothetical protein
VIQLITGPWRGEIRAMGIATFPSAGGLEKMLDVVFPITCPKCGRESLSSLPAAMINLALLNEGHLTLRSRCHRIEWQASPQEIEQIRQYLWAAQIA